MVRPWSRFIVSLAAAVGGMFGMPVGAQTVTYSLGTSSDLLDANFYAGGASSADNSETAIGIPRLVMNIGINNAGTEAIFYAIRSDNFNQGLFKVKIGDPSSWVRLQPDAGFAYETITWTPDDSAVFIGGNRRYHVDSGVLDTSYTIQGYNSGGTVTRLATNNWMIANQYVGVTDNQEIVAVPISPNGDSDPSRTPVIVTDFGFLRPVGLQAVVLPWISSQGDAVSFQLFDSSGVPDITDVYLIENLDVILAAPKIPSTNISSLAPTSLSDPNVVDVRASDSSNVASAASISQDGSLIFYCEDYNNVFDNENFFPSIAAGAWDINLARRDGTGDVRFNSSGNEGILNPFPTGNRLTYVKSVSGPTSFHVFATTLITESDINAESDPLPDGGTTAVINGNTEPLPFTLTDSAVQMTTPVTVADASGTVIDLPADQVINFPDGSGATGIVINTPIDPVSEAALPDPSIAIPVLREFGPDGTQFYPPITIAINYTDAEVADVADESNMNPYLYNSGTQTFEPLCAENDNACLSTIVVDTVNNTLTFQTSHFSTYGIGGAEITGTPQRPWAILVTTIALAAMALVALGARLSRMRKQN